MYEGLVSGLRADLKSRDEQVAFIKAHLEHPPPPQHQPEFEISQQQETRQPNNAPWPQRQPQDLHPWHQAEALQHLRHSASSPTRQQPVDPLLPLSAGLRRLDAEGSSVLQGEERLGLRSSQFDGGDVTAGGLDQEGTLPFASVRGVPSAGKHQGALPSVAVQGVPTAGNQLDFFGPSNAAMAAVVQRLAAPHAGPGALTSSSASSGPGAPRFGSGASLSSPHKAVVSRGSALGALLGAAAAEGTMLPVLHGRQQQHGGQEGMVLTQRQLPMDSAGDDLDWRGALGAASRALTQAMY